MAQIPTFKGKESINTGGSAPQESLGVVKSAQGAANEVVGSLEKVAQVVSNVTDFRQKAEANAFVTERLNGIKAEANQDPNFDDSRYSSAIDKAISDASSQISNAFVRDEFTAQAKQHAEVTKWDIRNTFRAKEIKAAQATLDYQGDVLINTQGDIGSDMRAEQLAAYKAQWTQAVAAGIYDKEVAKQKWYEFIQKYNKQTLSLDIAHDNAITKEDSYTYNQLMAGDKGIYAHIPSTQRAEAIDNVISHIGRNKRIYNYELSQDQDANERQMFTDWLDHKLDKDSVRESLLSGRVHRAFGEKMLKNFYEDVPGQTDYRKFNEVYYKTLKNAEPSEIMEYLADHPGELSIDDKKRLLNRAYKNGEKVQNMKLKASVDALHEWAVSSFGFQKYEEAAGMPMIPPSVGIVYDFLDRVEKNPANIDEILRETQRDYIKKYHPGTALLEDVPNLVATRNKIQRVYEKESKLKGLKVDLKPINSSTRGLSADDY